MADDNSIMSFLQGVGMGGNRNYNDGCGWGLLIVLFLVLLGKWENGCGRNNGMGYGLANATEFDSLLSGQNGIRNQMSYDNINSGIRGLERGICDSTYALNNTMTNGFANIQNSLCQGFNGVNTAISNLGFNIVDRMNTIASQNNLQLQNIQNTMQSCCCDIKGAITASTQAVLDKLCQNETQALRDRAMCAEMQLSQLKQTLKQTNEIVSQLKTTTTTTA